MRVYLDNGATTRVDDEVALEMRRVLVDSYGNPSSLHSFGDEAKKILDSARRNFAFSINASPEEIIFTSGGTEANNFAIKGIAFAMKRKFGRGKNEIVTSAFEHPSVLEVCKSLIGFGFKVKIVKPNKDGVIRVEDVQKAISKRTALISVMHANNEIGTIQPIEDIAELCLEKGVAFHTDAVQSFKKVAFDVVKNKGICAASFSGHKIHAAKGVGALFLRKEFLESVGIEKILHGGHQEFNLRAGTENMAGIVGFTKAAMLDISCEGIKNLRDMLIDGLLEIPKTMLNGSREKRLCNNVNVSFAGVEGESVLLHLNELGIAVSTGSACSSRSLEPSHVLLAIGLTHEEAHGSIRFTLSKYTTKEEIEYTIESVKKVVKNLRKISPIWRGKL